MSTPPLESESPFLSDPLQGRLAAGLVGLVPVLRHLVKLAGVTIGMLVVILPVVTARLEALLTDR
jgi:hypothetical protein